MRASIQILAGSTSLALTMLAQAGPVSIKLTTNALGLGSADLNGGSTVSPDFAGRFITSPAAGQGSLLWIQHSGLAGSGTIVDPLLVTVTARTRLDTMVFPSGFTNPNDYAAGIVFLTREHTGLPDGRDEGLGVRAFTVNTGTGAGAGLRQFANNGLAKIEGSKDVSGGTGPGIYNPADPNGAPHVDEDVLFNFDPASPMLAQSLVVTLSKFEASDRIDLVVNLLGGAQLTYNFAGPGSTASSAFTNPGDAVWHLNFAGLSGLSSADLVSSFAIRAVDDNPSNPSGTAEHFLISGFSGMAVPTPATAVILASMTFAAARRRRRARATTACHCG